MSSFQKIRAKLVFLVNNIMEAAEILLKIIFLLGKKEDKLNSKYVAIKPNLLSDEHLLTGLQCLRTVLKFVPGAQVEAAALSLGETGFKIWKAIALNKEYSTFKVEPLGVILLKYSFKIDPILAKEFNYLLKEEKWEELRNIYDSLWYICDPKILKLKYPQLPEEYIESCSARNTHVLQNSLTKIKMEIEKNKHTPEVDANLNQALNALEVIFPAMRDWALLQSESFKEVLSLVEQVI